MALEKLTRAGRELAVLAKQAGLMRHDLAPVLPDEARPGDDVVVCLHGLFATAGVLRPLREHLERHEGVHTAAMTYPVGPSVAQLARRLHAVVTELPPGVHVHLLGHSVGGIVARYFAQEIGDPRVVQTVSLASPFAGIRSAAWLRGSLARDLAPDSALLRSLRLGGSRRLGIPHLSVVAADDDLLRGPATQALAGGDVATIRGCGHNGMLYHDGTCRIVAERVVDFCR